MRWYHYLVWKMMSSQSYSQADLPTYNYLNITSSLNTSRSVCTWSLQHIGHSHYHPPHIHSQHIEHYLSRLIKFATLWLTIDCSTLVLEPEPNRPDTRPQRGILWPLCAVCRSVLYSLVCCSSGFSYYLTCFWSCSTKGCQLFRFHRKGTHILVDWFVFLFN